MGDNSDRGMILAWPTPMIRQRRADGGGLNAGLTELILELARKSPSAGHTSNIGSWKSSADLLKTAHPAIQELCAMISGGVGSMLAAMLGDRLNRSEVQFDAEAWANVYLNGAYQNPHVHSDSHVSGIYIVQTQDQVIGGAGGIEFFDPRPAAGVVSSSLGGFGESLIFKPEAGLFLVFPSWLSHCVRPIVGEGARISIAFNARMAAG